MSEDLKILFIEAYKAWIEAKTFSAREFAWNEYTQIRDLWLGKGTAYQIWSNQIDRSTTNANNDKENN